MHIMQKIKIVLRKQGGAQISYTALDHPILSCSLLCIWCSLRITDHWLIRVLWLWNRYSFLRCWTLLCIRRSHRSSVTVLTNSEVQNVDAKSDKFWGISFFNCFIPWSSNMSPCYQKSIQGARENPLNVIWTQQDFKNILLRSVSVSQTSWSQQRHFLWAFRFLMGLGHLTGKY